MNVCASSLSLSLSSSMNFPSFRRCFHFSKPLTLFSLSSSSSIITSLFSNQSSSAMASITTEATKPKQQQKEPWLIVGLGNPGKKYAGTRHSVGFEMVDTIAEAEGISLSSVSFKALFGKGFIGDVPVILAKPQTFMNSSGESGPGKVQRQNHYEAF